MYNIFHVTVGALDASIGSVQDGAKSSDNHSDIQVEPSITLPHPPTSVPTSVPFTGGVMSHCIAGSMSTSTCDHKDLSSVGRFLNNAQLRDSVLFGMDSDTIKILQTDSDLDDYIREHLKQHQQEEVKKHKEEQAKKREFAKMITEDINKKIKLVEIQQKKKKRQNNLNVNVWKY